MHNQYYGEHAPHLVARPSPTSPNPNVSAPPGQKFQRGIEGDWQRPMSTDAAWLILLVVACVGSGLAGWLLRGLL